MGWLCEKMSRRVTACQAAQGRGTLPLMRVALSHEDSHKGHAFHQCGEKD